MANPSDACEATTRSGHRQRHHLQTMEARRFLVLCLSFALLLSVVSAQLRTDFYKNTCPNVGSLVRSAVTKKFQQTFVTAPATLRLFFHDCFVRVGFEKQYSIGSVILKLAIIYCC